MIKPLYLFALSLAAILITYFTVLGTPKTLELLEEQSLFVLGLGILSCALFFFKFKLRHYETHDFFPNNTLSLKSTLIFFLVFQVVDYIFEDGFIGMISQWFLYWVMGMLALVLMQTINGYKNYALLKKIPKE